MTVLVEVAQNCCIKDNPDFLDPLDHRDYQIHLNF
jgi:hypothetical protein